MILYVVFHKSNYEGCSEPYAIFDSEEKASIFVAGSLAAYHEGMTIKEMNLNEVNK